MNNRRDFIKLGVMGVLGSLLPTDNTKGDTLIINTNNKVGMGITNPSQKLIIKGGYYPDGGIGIGCPHIPYEIKIRNI